MPPRKANLAYRALTNLPTTQAEEEPFAFVDLADIAPWEAQPRRSISEADEKFLSLVDSIKEHGILQPLLVRPLGNLHYQLVAGERRWRAAMRAGLRQVPVVIKTLSDRQARECALIENLQRDDLNPIEETEAILTLLIDQLDTTREGVIRLLNRMSHELQGEATASVSGQTQAQEVAVLFERLGRMTWQSFLKNRIPLLDMSEDVLSAVREGRLDYSKAKLIAQIKDDAQRTVLLEEAVCQSLTFRDLQQQVQKLLRPHTTATPAIRLRFETAAKKLRKSGAWEDPQRASRLQTLIEQLESLLGETVSEDGA